MSGRIISHYRILEEIGEGGMGVVYKAQDLKLDKTVALKILPANLALDSTIKLRFIQEAKAASALDHPNITIVHELDEYRGELFIVMEYLQGKSLGEIAKENLDINKILEIGIQICSGLQAAHEKQIIHRDIKSENIMVNPKGQVKIMDFGLAKLRGTDKLTKTGFTAGTIIYMSPEQIQGEEVDHRSDIFSLGVVLYELITGTLPFRGEHPSALLYSILNEEPHPLARFNKQSTEELERIIRKLLEKDKRNRYQHVEEVMVDLRRALQNREKLGERKRKTYIFAGILLLLVLGFAGIFWKWGRKSAVPSGEKPAIAVLHLQNMSEQPEDDYFAAGMTEDIITELSKIEGLRVASRSDVEQFKESSVDIVKLADKLKVGYVLEGSVRKSEGTVRITTQLIRAQDGFHVWADRFDRKLKDIFAIQDEVAKKVAEALKVRLAPHEVTQLTKIPTSSLQAYDYFLKGREYIWGEKTSLEKEKIDLSVKLLEKAIQLDPNFAAAYVELGEAYTSYNYRFIDLDPVWLEKAEKVIKKALKIEPDMAQAHRALGRLYASQSQIEKALEEYKNALKLKSNYAEANYSLGMLYAENLQDFKTAITYYHKVLELKPTDVSALLELAYSLLLLARYDSSLAYLRQVQDLEPGLSRTFYYRGLVKLRLDQMDSTLFFFDQASKYSSDFRGRLTLAERLIMIRQSQRAIPMLIQSQDPSLAFGKYYLLGWAYLLERETKKSEAYFDTALISCQQTLRVLGEVKTYYQHMVGGVVYALRGNYKLAEKEAEMALKSAEMDRNGEALARVALGITYIYIIEKNYEKAFASLKEVVRNNYFSKSEVRLDPRLEELRKRPEFQTFFTGL